MHSSDLDVSKDWKRNEGNEVMKKSYSNSDKNTNNGTKRNVGAKVLWYVCKLIVF